MFDFHGQFSKLQTIFFFSLNIFTLYYMNFELLSLLASANLIIM
jgi:hypothetical protein